MPDKLTPLQAAQLAALETFPPRFQQAHRMIEELASLRADPSLVQRLSRLLDQTKAVAHSLGESGMADTLGLMAMLSRRRGDHQMRVRGLREGLLSLKFHYETAVRLIRENRLGRVR